MMSRIMENHKKIWSKPFVRLCLEALVLFVLSLVVNYYCTLYAQERASAAISDIILSHTRVYDVDEIIIVFSLAVFFVAIAAILAQPKKMPFVFKSIAVFILIRSIFITLTHIGPFTPHLLVSSNFIVSAIGLGHASDLFFSGHTGMPFLLALIFWQERWFRYFFLLSSAVLGTSMLLGHLHYSIDVFSAYLITFAIFHMSRQLFVPDWNYYNTQIA